MLDQKLKATLVHPTEESLKHMVNSKILNNSPIKVEDVTNTHTIFGPNIIHV